MQPANGTSGAAKGAAKGFASLSPTLLARKGAAKPAMRSQFQALASYPEFECYAQDAGEEGPGHEDLGWNDMGEPAEHSTAELAAEAGPEAATILPFTAGGGGFKSMPQAAGIPQVVRHQEVLAVKFEAANSDEGKAAKRGDRTAELTPMGGQRAPRGDQAAPRRSALAAGRRAAFTLRVDEERHLKLRLACTIAGRSAQQLITEALDRLLDDLPEIEDLARRVKRR